MDDATNNSELVDTSIGPIGRIGARVLTAFIVCEFAALAGVAFVSIEAYQEIFKDFDTTLPWATMVLIEWRPVIAGGFCFVAILAVVKDLLLPRPLDRVIVNLVLFVIGFVSILYVWMALYMPFVAIIQSVTR